MSIKNNRIHNTRRLQIYTLSVFMWDEFEAVFCGNGYHDGNNFYTFDEAVSLYNNFENKDDIKGIGIEEVHLVLSKKDKKIICKKHLVKFHPRVKEFLSGQDAFKFLNKVSLSQ